MSDAEFEAPRNELAKAAPAPKRKVQGQAATPEQARREASRSASGEKLISNMFHWPLLSERRARDSAVGKSGHVSVRYVSYPLLSERKPRDSAVGKARFASQSFLGYPLLSPRMKRDSAVGRSATSFSKWLGWRLLSKRA